MKTREELLREKEEIEKQLKALELAEYSKKIIILSNPDTTEGRIPFYYRKEFYIKEAKTKTFQTVENFKKLIEHICAKKYGLYDGIMGTISLMECFLVRVENVNGKYEDLPIFDLNELSSDLEDALKQIEEFLMSISYKQNV